MSTIGERLEAAIRFRETTPYRLAKATGNTRGYVSRVFNDERENPQADKIRQLADHLHVNAQWLLFGDGTHEPNAAELDELAEACAVERAAKRLAEGEATTEPLPPDVALIAYCDQRAAENDPVSQSIFFTAMRSITGRPVTIAHVKKLVLAQEAAQRSGAAAQPDSDSEVSTAPRPRSKRAPRF